MVYQGYKGRMETPQRLMFSLYSRKSNRRRKPMDLEKYKRAPKSGNKDRRIYISFTDKHPAYPIISALRNTKKINVEELVYEEFLKKLPTETKPQ
jgi:hypothetical protein